MEPLIVSDVERIIRCIPLGDPALSLDASLFNFAVATGARAISCASIHLEDLTDMSLDRTTKKTLLTIRIPIGKGRPSWNHYVTLEGYMEIFGYTDAVYWINTYLKEKFNTPLSKLK